jgi:nitrous oxide reductase accessory protein NosL
MIKIIYVFTFLSFLMACQNKTKEKHQHNKDQHHTQHKITESPECRNCGMPVNDMPNWNVKVTNQNNEITFFCCPRCYMEMAISPEGEKEFTTYSKVEVRNFLYPQIKIPFAEVFWVVESGEKGPMGYDFVPFAEKENAQKFIKKKGKGKILNSQDLTPENVKKILNWKP